MLKQLFQLIVITSKAQLMIVNKLQKKITKVSKIPIIISLEKLKTPEGNEKMIYPNHFVQK
jgi:hypothetical protein